MRGWRWLAPAVVVLLVMTVWPLGRGIWTSLRVSSLSTPDDRTFVGVDNYTEVLTNRGWWLAVAVTLVVVIAAVMLQLLLGLAFAAALRRLTIAWPITRVLVLVPFALLSVVAAVVWRDAVTTGFVHEWFGLGEIGQIGQIGSLVAVTFGEVWRGTAIVTVILLAGLSRVPPTLVASALADGATAWQRLRRISIPALGPAVAIAVTYRALDAFRMLEGPLVIDARDVDLSTAPLAVWDTTTSTFELGLGAAMSVLLLIIAALLGVVLTMVLRVRRVL